MLITFKRNLTPDLIADITIKGMPPALLQGVADLAEPLDKANTTQEKLKGSVKEASDNVITELNTLYTEIIGICKIASNHFKKEPVKKEMFTFAKVLRNIGEERTAKTEKEKLPEA
jgi:flagellar motor switch protein FliG